MKYLTLFGGLGDHVLWLGLLAHVPEPKTVACDPRMEALARLYAGRSYDHLVVTSAQPRASDGWFLCWHPTHVGDEYRYLGERDATVADVVRDILGLPAKAEIVAPKWGGPWDFWMAGRSVLPGRTVLLAPWAHTAEIRLSDQWWIDAATWLRSLGVVVLTNTANRGRGFDQSRRGPILDLIPGTLPVDIPLDEIGPFAELCGHVLMSRSGLSDLLVRTQAKTCVLWPTEGGRPSQREMDVWSVRRIYGASGVVERRVDAGAAFDPTVLEGWLG